MYVIATILLILLDAIRGVYSNWNILVHGIILLIR